MKPFLFKFIALIIFVSNIANADIIKNIEILGNSRISDNTIIDIIDFDKSKNYSINDLNNFQKKLFESNFFKNINLSLKNDTLKITVSENPLIEFFYIQGVVNKSREDLIYEKVKLGPNKIFSESLLKKDIDEVKNIYKVFGYFNVTIKPEISKLLNGNINVVMNIDRGEKYYIKRIFFIGDKHFKSSTLLNVVSASEHGWWKFLSSSSTLNTDRIEFDKQLLKNFYLNQGFYDAQIISSDINFLKNNKASITYSINSGSKYKFSKFDLIDTENNLNKKNIETINNLIANTIKGDFSLKKVNDVRKKIYTYLNTKRIQFVNFDIIQKKLDKNNIYLEIAFKKTARNFVNQINVKGNSITEEEVIRRELIFSEGDSFSRYKLDKSKDNLLSSNIFKKIETNIKNLDNEMVDVEFIVEEQPTGTISAGLGIGSAGSSVTTAVSEKNLFGKGINLNTNFDLGTERIKGLVSAAIPDFKNSDNILLLDVFAVSTDFENVGYESSAIGSSIGTSYYLLEDVTFRTNVGVEMEDISTNSSASQLYKDRAGEYLTLKTSYDIKNDKRDRRFKTTKGHMFNFGQSFGLPGSDIPYIENNISGVYYYPFNDDYILSFKSGLSSINALSNKDVKLSDRKFLSNKKLRGFENFGVGPKDGTDHIGGNYSIYSSLASTLPNPFPEKWNADSTIFFDAGNVWGVDFDSSKDSNKIRSSVGLGLDWISPLGPISFIFAQALSSADGDLEENFSFQIGSSF